MVNSSAYAMQLALSGASRIGQGETPELKKATNLTRLQGEQNIDYFEESLTELQARDNAEGGVSIHIFTAGKDQDPTVGKLQVGNLKAEFTGDTQNGTRFSVEDRGEVQKIKSYRYEPTRIVAFEATVKPNNEVETSVLILDRQNPEKSQIGKATSEWLLSV